MAARAALYQGGALPSDDKEGPVLPGYAELGGRPAASVSLYICVFSKCLPRAFCELGTMLGAKNAEMDVARMWLGGWDGHQEG